MVSPFISFSVPHNHQQQQQLRSEPYPQRKCLHIPSSPRNRRLLFNRSRGQSLVCRALFIRRAMMASVALSKHKVMVVAGDNTTIALSGMDHNSWRVRNIRINIGISNRRRRSAGWQIQTESSSGGWHGRRTGHSIRPGMSGKGGCLCLSPWDDGDALPLPVNDIWP